MNWLQMDRYYLESDCGRYTVDRACIDRKPDGKPVLRFTAWVRGRPSENLGCCNDPDTAKQLCEDHSRRTTELEFAPMEASR